MGHFLIGKDNDLLEVFQNWGDVAGALGCPLGLHFLSLPLREPQCHHPFSSRQWGLGGWPCPLGTLPPPPLLKA